MKNRIIDKSKEEFCNCPHTAEGQVFICHTYAEDGTFTGTLTADQETVDEFMNDLTEPEREFLGWGRKEYKDAMDDIKREGIVLCKCKPEDKQFKDKTELHNAMREKGINP